MSRLAFLFLSVTIAMGAATIPLSAQVAQTAAPPISQVQPTPGMAIDPVAASAAARASQGLPQSDAGVAAEGEPYKIRVGDRLGISVLEDPTLNMTVLVLPDGRISMPIAGSIFVAGKTLGDIEKTLKRQLAGGFAVQPTVTVAVAGLAPLAGAGLVEPVRFFVMGAMNSHGMIETLRPLTLLEAIAMAGGPTAFANTKRLQLRRLDANGVETVTVFDFEKVEEGLAVLEHPQIMDGDIIYAPERGLWD